MTALEFVDYRSWINKKEVTEDIVDIRPARLMQSILPLSRELINGGDLPVLWHWLYFHNPVALDEIGRDGHPKLGGFLPPIKLPRRMWAGGRFKFNDRIKFGDCVKKQSKIIDIKEKIGKSGPLCFVTVQHLFFVDEKVVLEEEHDIVYRDDPKEGDIPAAPIHAPVENDRAKVITPSPVMLFRYSALTFNGHRIHYDRHYCQETEGYPGLIFHGPLTATLLANFASSNRQTRMRSFSFRAVSPLFDTAPFSIFLSSKNETAEVWASNPDGNLAMKAKAEFV